jgi:shikimate kinase
VIVVGLMGAGKTSIGTRLARRLGRQLIDSDEELERRTGRTAREILAADGIDALHAQEAAVVNDALAVDEPAVIGAPASIVLDPEMRERLAREQVVWLRADPQWLTEKMRRKDDEHKSHRPFVDRDPDVLLRQHEERKDLYAGIASVIVDTTRRDKDDVADEIVDKLSREAGSAG